MIQKIDNFLNEDKLEKYKDKSIWSEISEQGYHWLDRKSKSSNIFEDFILNDLAKCFTNEIEGFEYWINFITPNKPLNWHTDKDEFLNKSGEIVHPFKSTVWYGYPHEVQGGEFEAESINKYIEPLYNRLIAFDGYIKHRVRYVVKGIRLGLSVNLWKQKPTHLKFKSPIKESEIDELTIK